ncbi:hypothetical protein GOODEAATRI_028485 [Goodea atripinnis]|uniref:Uncharacterized protein n=1 Tax=Goodea atripinnis TaxID=208336 RepID=A0ABV0PSP9_9TELE
MTVAYHVTGRDTVYPPYVVVEGLNSYGRDKLIADLRQYLPMAPSSPAVSLVYTVKNGTVFLNGTVASNLLGQLSAELVGYFLFYPPLVIAERKSHFL